jgi:hypothetical protein
MVCDTIVSGRKGRLRPSEKTYSLSIEALISWVDGPWTRVAPPASRSQLVTVSAQVML